MNGQNSSRRSAPDINGAEYRLQKQKAASHQKVANDVESATLIEALKLLDPDGTLVPGTSDFDNTKAMVIKWTRRYGPGQALEMVERSVKLMKNPMQLT